MTVYVMCAGNLALVHRLFCEMGLSEKVTCQAGHQTLAAHLTITETEQATGTLLKLVEEGCIRSFSIAGTR
jgi:hypothetical protein